MILRDYQQAAITQARESIRKGNKNICLCLCVGAGKSLIAKTIMESAKGKIGFFSFRKVLIEQIKKYNIPNVTTGTLQKHGKDLDTEYNLIIVDEKDFHGTKMKNNIKTKFTITLSGTPCDENGYALEFDDIVDIVQLPDLIKMGYAKPIRVLSISKVDTSTLKKSGKDFNKTDSFNMMEKARIKKDLVDTYKTHCIGRKTLLFAIDIKHAESLKDEFTANGVTCEVIHSKSKDKDVLERYENNEFDLLINVAMISVGVDIPSINTILFARPMASIPLFIQCIGRATRINPLSPNDEALIIDCADILNRTNHHPMQKLDFTKTKQSKGVKSCQCGLPMFIIGKKVTQNDQLTYTTITRYKCKCGAYEDVEKMSVLNLAFCKECDEQLTDKNITMKQTKKSIEFVIKCEGCGCDNVQRSVLLSDKELKELEYQETINGEDTWEKVRAILKDEAKKCNYKWQWVDRAIDILKNKNKTPSEVLVGIDNLVAQGRKVGSIVYVS